jgi:hypothetical protein
MPNRPAVQGGSGRLDARVFNTWSCPPSPCALAADGRALDLPALPPLNTAARPAVASPRTATGASHRFHTSVATHRPHTVDSTGCWRPARAPRLLRAPPSSHSRLHWPLASCACAAPAKKESPIRLLVPLPPPRPTVFTPLARPTIFTPSTLLAVGVLRVRHASCESHRLHTVDSTGRRRPARAPRLLADAGILTTTSYMHPHKR